MNLVIGFSLCDLGRMHACACVCPYDLGRLPCSLEAWSGVVALVLHFNLTGEPGNIKLCPRAEFELLVYWHCLDSYCLFVMHM